MALKIRLTRIGSTHQPHYRVVVAEARSRRDGAPVDVLGTYDPRAAGGAVKLNLERVDYWIGKGAKPSDTLNSMIKRARRGVAAAPAGLPTGGAAEQPGGSPAAAHSAEAGSPPAN